MNDKTLKVLVIGSGGREHTLVRAIKQSPLAGEVICAPGNAGIESEVRCLPLNIEDVAATVALALAEHVDFVVVGPEVPLALGVVDALEAEGISAYGPKRAGARLEASKAYTKDFLAKYAIPTAGSKTFTDVEPALNYLALHRLPVVIKASGLAAGKGVIIAQTLAEAVAATRSMLEGNLFGTSGHEVVIEEFMDGEEVSLMLMVSGDKYIQLPPSQDHKRVGDGDTGPNTGGMGAYAPATIYTESLRATVVATIIEPTLRGLIAEGIDYRGTLYVGLMLTASGPKVVEFNARFGDPETQVLLPLLETDALALMIDCAKGKLNPQAVSIKSDSAIIVVMAAGGYPGNYNKGDPISIPAHLPAGVHVIHAGTKRNADGTIGTAGGRVLGVTAVAPTLQAAADAAYKACATISWSGAHYRKDIGGRQLKRE
ncbi:MAG: phosphoribosylamine--glycine ligase [Verrucomicrobiota bacterium]|nr:phosphoribosylamine--glycine ligase [Verrucomicrobiota bacterium]